MKESRPLLLLLFVVLSVLNGAAEEREFVFRTESAGIWLYEAGKPVYYYRKMPKIAAGQYVCNNYLHPVFTPAGDTLTEEFPADHPYHRGIYWAWHQVFIGEQRAGDGWVLENLSQEVVQLRTSVNQKVAKLSLEVDWKSSVWQNGRPFLSENTTVWVYPTDKGIRFIDFEIRLRALVPGVRIGGSEDEKGYGGFCTRIKLPEDLTFTAIGGRVTPQVLQIGAGKWMDFNGTFGASGKSGMVILCHPQNPLYPSPWILRQTTSMQNAVYPGQQCIAIDMVDPVVLRYRLVIYEGSTEPVKIEEWQESYSKTEVSR